MTILFPVFVLLGIVIFFTISKSTSLKANNSDPHFVDILNGEKEENLPIEIKEQSKEVTLQAKELGMYELPYDEKKVSVTVVGKDELLPYYEVTSDEFRLEGDTVLLKNTSETKATDEGAMSSSEEMEEEAEKQPESAIYKVTDKDDATKGFLYLNLKVGEKVSLQLKNSSEKDQTVILYDGKDPKKRQQLALFTSLNKKTSQSSKVKRSVTESNSPGIDFGTVEIDSKKIQDGTENFDPDDNPGHDSSNHNKIVRTFDTVNYPVSFSLINTSVNTALKNIKYRIDATFDNAIDTVNGQKRKYVEFGQGTYTGNENDLSQKAVYSSEGTVSQAGQISQSVTLKVDGATNGYKVKPVIKVTILSAEDSTGKVIPINKTSDDLVKDTVIVSAKPNITADINIDNVQSSIVDYNDFAKINGNSDKDVTVLGTTIALVPLQDAGILRQANDYRGSTYPVGKVTAEIDIDTEYIDLKDSSKNVNLTPELQEPSQIISYGLASYRDRTSSSFTLTKEYSNIVPLPLTINDGGSITRIPFSFSSMPTSNPMNFRELNESGKFLMNNEGANRVSFSFSQIPTWNVKEKVGGVNNTNNINNDRRNFSSGFALVTIPYKYLLDKEGSIVNTYKISSIIYENDGNTIKKTIDASTKFTRSKSDPGSAHVFDVFQDKNDNPLGSGSQAWAPSGDSKAIAGEQINSQYVASVEGRTIKYVEGITEWNAEALTLQEGTPSIWAQNGGKIISTLYGVLKNKGNTPSLKNQYDVMHEQYNWYQTKEEALKYGQISALYAKSEKVGLGMPNIVMIPKFKVSINQIGGKDKNGQPIFLMGSCKGLNSAGKTVVVSPDYGKPEFIPTIFNSDGSVKKIQSPIGHYGDSLFIDVFRVRISKNSDKSSYTSTDVNKWTLKPSITSYSEENPIVVTLKDTLPKGLQYISGSSKSENMNVGEPQIVKNIDGTTNLIWEIIVDKENTLKDITYSTQVDYSQIVYDDNHNTNLKNKVMISGAFKDSPEIQDSSPESQRTTEAQINITQVTQVVVAKTTSDNLVEVGNEDPANDDNFDEEGLKTRLDDIHYNIYAQNDTTNDVMNVRLLDVLPFDGDKRGTTYSGKLRLISASLKNKVSNAKVYYSTENLSAQIDPNKIDLSDGWKLYEEGKTVNNITAVLIVVEKLQAHENVSLDFIVSPENQKSGEVFINDSILNSSLNLRVVTPHVSTRVISRLLSGLAWYDDNLDGMKDANEEIASNIPVKLYRTSQTNTSYQDQLVTKTLSGEALIDSSGNSLVKTNGSGEYQFTDLPEGEYVAYFDIGKEVQSKRFKVTKKDPTIASQAPNTSKVDQTTYKTDNYEMPTLKKGIFTNDQWKVEHINVGLIRPSRIRLFKYSEGSAIDANKDGKLSDTEKASGTPLSGAVFELYKGDQEEKLGSATTNSDGSIEFDQLYSGEYTLVETKAPKDYELAKKPIKVTITKGNETIPLYVENQEKSELPFTGGKGLFGLLLVAALGVLVVGFTSILWFYRPKIRKGGK